MAKSGYDVYLGKVLLPVTPEKIQMKINGQNKTVNLINDGEINIVKVPGLTDIEFECCLPQVKYPYAKYLSGFKNAKYYLEQFEKWKTGKKKFQFIVSRQSPNGKQFFSTNIKVTLEDYKITEDAKEGFDVKVKINLKQWKSYGAKTVKIKIKNKKPKVNTPQPSRPAETAPKTYKQGDIVNFHGGTHYVSSYAGSKGYSARAGQARITLDPNCKGNGGVHPWHLIHTDGSSNVYGWVDNGTFD